MKCKKSTGDCKLDVKFEKNGDVLEFCTICDFKYLHKFKDIQNNYLNTNKIED
jgi:hypothetical protein